jgi:hypothetical protein
MKFMDALIVRPSTRAKVRKFLQVVANDRSSKLQLQPSLNYSQDFDSLIHEARGQRLTLPSIPEYLSDAENKDFAKLVLLCLVGSAHPFQPNRTGEWMAFQPMIHELLADGLIDSGGYTGTRGDPGEYILCKAGERFIQKATSAL